MTKLADVLSFAGTPEKIADPSLEKFVTLRMHGKGAVERQIKDGKTPVPFTGYRVRSGQFMYSRIDARNGAFAIVPAELDGAVVSKDFPVFEIRSDLVEANYLRHLFLGGVLQASIRASSFGATNRQRVDESAFLGLEAPIPSLDEQRRITAILDVADQIRRRRRALLDRFNVLTRAVFWQMFGQDAPLVPIKEFADVRSGSTPSRTEPNNYGGGIPWVKTGEVQGSIIRATSETVSEEGVRAARLKLFAPGSVVVAMYGQGRTRGQSAILGVPATTNQACAVILPNERFDSVFLQSQLTLAYDRLRGEAEGGNQPNLSVGRVESFPVVLPPIVEQKTFAACASAIAAERIKAEGALAADDELFASLQSSAFSGRL
jgi:type I restriction enzyme S subunit